MKLSSTQIRKVKRHPVLSLFVLTVFLFTTIHMYRRIPDIEIVLVDISGVEQGSCLARFRVQNRATKPLGFHWLDAEDRDFSTEDPEPLLVYPGDLGGAQLASGDSLTYTLPLPPPGTARRYRLRYYPALGHQSRLLGILWQLYPGSKTNLGARIIKSPEAACCETAQKSFVK